MGTLFVFFIFGLICGIVAVFYIAYLAKQELNKTIDEEKTYLQLNDSSSESLSERIVKISSDENSNL